MAPGVVSIQPSHNVSLPLQEDQLVCVRCYSRDEDLPAMAVGKMTMTSDLVEKTDKGKAVLTLHSYGDMLWERGGKGEPPRESTTIRSNESAAQVPVDEAIIRPSQSENSGGPVETIELNSEGDGSQPVAQAGGSNSADMERISATGTVYFPVLSQTDILPSC
jgi:hypothetical protein